jgi:hypothetical protein
MMDVSTSEPQKSCPLFKEPCTKNTCEWYTHPADTGKPYCAVTIIRDALIQKG